MKYVISGYNGFLGNALQNEIISDENNSIYAVCRIKHRGQIDFPPNVIPIWADMMEYKTLYDNIGDADVFVHCSWSGMGYEMRNDRYVHQLNVQYSLDAIRSAARVGCKVFIETGSQAEYGFIKNKQIETAECSPFSEYGKAKLDLWYKGKELAEQLGMRYVHLRIFSLYGVNDRFDSMIMQCLHKMCINEMIGLSKCTQKWNYLYVDDAAKMIVQLCHAYLSNPQLKSNVYNVASEDTRPLMDFVEQMRTITNTKSEIRFGVFKPQFEVSLDPSIEKIKNIISPSFTSFDVGIRRIIKSNKLY